jgi:hypothetical protein
MPEPNSNVHHHFENLKAPLSDRVALDHQLSVNDLLPQT